MGVGVANLVSVSVRPGRRSERALRGTTGHHSCFVQRLPLLAAAAPAIGFEHGTRTRCRL